MKVALLTLSILFFSTRLFAQKIELSIQANSGLFHYSGNDAASTSFINEGSDDKLNNINNPYGNKNGFSYGGDIQAQYVSKSGFITGLRAGYEVLRSKVDIDEYNPILITIFTENPGGFQIPVKGQTFLQDQEININPYIGYRLDIKKIKVDIMPGLDVGFNVNSYEKGSATGTDGTVYKVDYKMLKAPADVGLRLNLAASFKRFGLTAGYVYGLTNFASNLDVTAGGSSSPAPKIHSELIRFGISYRIF
jgi:hypothetical protein